MLSILIPSIPERSLKLNKLLLHLQKQIDYCDNIHRTLGKVEVVVDDSKRFLQGGLSIGDKRNSLLNRSSGKYICFLDDDDWTSMSHHGYNLRFAQDGQQSTEVKMAKTHVNVMMMQMNIKQGMSFWQMRK